MAEVLKITFASKIICLKSKIYRKKFVSLHKDSSDMAKATIQSVRQTETAGLFTICFEGESYDEFRKFIMKGEADATLQPDLKKILDALQRMLSAVGFLERYFRPEGKMKDRVVALPIDRSRLRLYCLRLSDGVLIVGNGGQKATRTYDEDSELSGYVLTLQKLDELLKSAERKGTVSIEKTSITGMDDKLFEL
ncbi:MAG: hypothetical protein IJ892_10605 [Prevotella sp.]|nr:hypothetical protein [Prevotella sp.]